jgi:hypothetical protein
MSETYNPSPAPVPPPVKRDLHGRPVMVRNRRDAATAWLIVFTALMGLLMIITFIVTGNVFHTTTSGGHILPAEHDFNGGLAFGAAAGVALAWLPVIALFDYLRRRAD